ncbi:ABC-type multidrug transport system permease subunit [Sporosarcina luteola]|nr:ABC-type multidrug transport system permease subunit [Sporosarcina luteola]
MNRERKNVPFTQEEKENSIAFILNEVNLQPVTFRKFLRSYFHEVGFRYLFWGMEDILFIVGLLLIGVGTLYFPDLNLLFKNGQTDEIYFTVFMASPLCYALLYFLGIWKERLLGTFELKMTLRVSLKELLILRMLAFSGISLVVSVGSNVFIWQLMSHELSLMRLFSLSFSSLFLFANMQLLLEYKIPMRCSHWLTPSIWGAVGVLFIWTQDWIAQFLLYVPLSIVIMIVFGLLLLFIYLLRHNYFMEKEGTITYANA